MTGTVLVTGASGFVGQHVCRLLQQRELEFLATDLQDPATPLDVTDRTACADLFRRHKIDAVIHLAAVLPTAAHRDPRRATQVNTIGGCHLLEEAVAAGVRRFVFGSSTAVYGFTGKMTLMNEDAAQPNEIYGASKRFVEIYGEALAQAAGLSFVALRMATVIGLGVRNSASPWRSQILDRTVSGATLPCSEQTPLSLVHAFDVAEDLLTLTTAKVLSHPCYNTPAETMPAGQLKRLVESIVPGKTVSLEGERGRVPAPLADGSRFSKEFAYRPLSLESRIREAHRS